MSFLTLMLVLASSHLSIADATPTCESYSARCECFPNVPFEGYKVYVVETCDGKEQWWTEYAAPAFDTESACREGIKTDPVCQNL